MSLRHQIATYLPKGTLESLDAEHVAPRGADARKPTTEELADLVRGLQILENTQGSAGVMATIPDPLVANLQTFMATVMGPAEDRLSESRNGTLEAKFDSHDILGWAGSFFTWWQKLSAFEWRTPGSPQVFPDACRLALFGDWGTGLYGAPECANSIAKDGRYNLVLHLGDVYYSGTSGEIDDRFIAIWPHVPGATNRALNGNHEMYTGGRAYFHAVSTHFGQSSSYFAMENSRWILACLDTSYQDHDLYGDQAQWVRGLADGAPEKKLLLFSHHQPFSLLDEQGPNLIKKLAPLFERKRIYGWYWGHEHHCILYKPHTLYGLRGRCVGHGGFPYFRETAFVGKNAPVRPEWKSLESRNLVPSGKILDGENPYIEGHAAEYGPNGYMSLEFDGDDLYEIVHMPDGTEVWNQPVERLDS